MNGTRLFTTLGCGWVARMAGLTLAVSGAFQFVTISVVQASDARVVFNRDVRPILSDACLACHGPDSGKRKANLRLDTKEGLFGATKDEGPVITPGSIEKSALWRRIVSGDKDEVMPPPDSHKELKTEQKEILKRWIADGAPWQSHWSLIKPVKAALPAVKNTKWGRGAIDAFVLSKLEETGLTPAPEADRRTLARRLSLDLTGLPPTTAEVEAFVADRSADYYAKYVKRLMDSPAWGEHRARYWLDAARYADTHGMHFDNYREMWPYREWVIKAFNRNLPFDRFTTEQIAGDLLPNPTQDQLVATGFQRCAMSTNEGGTIEEENLVNYANDRVTTTGWVFLGLTLNCAACHDHKFDPVSTKDFYSLAAFFRNTTQPGYDGNVKDSAPSITVVTDPADEKRWKSLPGEIEAAKKGVERAKSEAEPHVAAWASALKREDLEKNLKGDSLAFRAPLDEGATDRISATAAGVGVQVVPVGMLKTVKDPKLGSATVFEKGVTAEFPSVGDYEHGQAFSFGAWVFVPENYNETAAIFSRMDEANNYRGWDLWIQQGQFASHIVSQWPGNAIKVRTNKRLAKKNQWQQVFVTYDGSGKPEGLRIFVDGVAAAMETDNGAGVTGSIRTKTSFKLAQRSPGAHFDGLGLQDVRIYSRVLATAEVAALAHSSAWGEFLGKPFAEWKGDAKQQALDYYLTTQYAPFQEAQKRVGSLEREREGLRLKYPVTLVQMEKKDSPAMANILFRGQYDKPKDKVGADVIGVLHRFPEGAPRNRLGLSQWLTSPENPLTARVTVNRFWQEVFGVGLVRSVEDFGVVGENPINPALLDWLAVEFQESGWDVKKLFLLMVSSSAYRQSAVSTPMKLEKDPANRLLSRGPRFRMDAEMVRDYALASSGLLKSKIGGPSVKPYQPDGVWEAVAMPESNTRRYQRDSGEGLYRRSLYTFWKRAAPPALMDIFNAPSRETCSVRRERTNTPLQALATLNDPQFVEAARYLAQMALGNSKGNTRRAITLISQRVLARELKKNEMVVVKQTLDQLTAYYSAHPEEAKKLLQIGEAALDPKLKPTDMAAWTMVANQFLNLDEALCK